MCGRRGMPAWPEYSASKFALCGLTEALRGELARFDIDVLLIVPGPDRRRLAANTCCATTGKTKIEFDKGMPPEEVAGRHPAQPGEEPDRDGPRQRGAVDPARQPLLPRLVDWLMARQVRQLYAESSRVPAYRRATEGVALPRARPVEQEGRHGRGRSHVWHRGNR